MTSNTTQKPDICAKTGENRKGSKDMENMDY